MTRPEHPRPVPRTPERVPPMEDPLAEKAHREEHAWLRVRLIGWGILVLVQVLIIAQATDPKFLPTPVLLWFLPSMAIMGIFLVAYGFLRFVRAGHQRAGLDRP